MNPPVIPANDIVEAFISIAFIAIAFISWIIRLVGQSREEAQAKARVERQGRRPPRVAGGVRAARGAAQSEVDAFLRGAAAPPRNRAEDDIEVEIVPEDEMRERSSPRDRRTAEPTPWEDGADRSDLGEWDRRYAARREQLRSNVAEREWAAAPLGEELRRTIEQTVSDAESVQKQRDAAEQELSEARQRIDSLRESAAGRQGMLPARARGGDVAAMLRNPQSVRDAIVINEVLNRPRALRR